MALKAKELHFVCTTTNSMASTNLHVFFFPFMAHGHMIPILDMATAFAARGATATIITTPLNAASFHHNSATDDHQHHRIRLLLLPFPSSQVGLPDGCEDVSSITSPDAHSAFLQAAALLQTPFENLLLQHRPDCLVSDIFLPWTAAVARKHGIPRISFHGSSFFSTCVGENITRFKPHEKVASANERFVVPGLPHPIELTASQLSDSLKSPSHPFAQMLDRMEEADDMAYGFVMNSFYELEPDYAEYFKEELHRKAWQIGPLSLYSRRAAERGKKASIGEEECRRWLDAMEPGSVVYVCFGSLSRSLDRQLLEIASALEASGKAFIWAVRKNEEAASSSEPPPPWLPEGFEERTKGKGLIIRGWAPQVLILNHPAIGAFVTHCGWNSVMEGVAAGVPMVTWPAFAEQFFNEKLVVDVVKIGVAVGAADWVPWWQEEERVVVARKGIEAAIRRVMEGGDEAEGMRRRAKELKEMAWRAVGEGGSSHVDLSWLIEELKMVAAQQQWQTTT